MKLEEFFPDLKKGKSWILGWVVFSDMLKILSYFYSTEIALIYGFQSISLIRTNTVEFKLSLYIMYMYNAFFAKLDLNIPN